jgi:hypothetical protein
MACDFSWEINKGTQGVDPPSVCMYPSFRTIEHQLLFQFSHLKDILLLQ